MRAAAALHEADREPFINAVVCRLRGEIIGDGSIHRAIRRRLPETADDRGRGWRTPDALVQGCLREMNKIFLPCLTDQAPPGVARP